MAFEFRLTRRVEFPETDMAGIVHYANFFRYMEAAEHAFFRSLGASVVYQEAGISFGFPRVHAECDYRKPLRFEDEFVVRLLVREKRTRTLSYLFRFHKTADPEIEIARGVLTVVCTTHQDGKISAVPLPPGLSEKISVAPPEFLLSTDT